MKSSICLYLICKRIQFENQYFKSTYKVCYNGNKENLPGFPSIIYVFASFLL